jgi:hypothetical protein
MKKNIRPTNLKLHNFLDETFIHGVYIPEYVCDNLIDYFEQNSLKQKNGRVYSNGTSKGKEKFKFKKSKDIYLNPFENVEDEKDLSEYLQYLNMAIQEYEHKYDRVRYLERYTLKSGCNIQKYKPKDGFYEWHAERGGINTQDRCLVWMTYLNDVPKGGTEFMYQKLTVPAKKGLTLIWPSDWTHTHKGQVSNKHTKYIITGWFNYLK